MPPVTTSNLERRRRLFGEVAESCWESGAVDCEPRNARPVGRPERTERRGWVRQDKFEFDAKAVRDIEHLFARQTGELDLWARALAEAEAAIVTAGKFAELADRWENETRHLSSLTAKAAHAAHQEIIRMGEAAIPLILQRMCVRPGFWFEALEQLAPAANPVKPSMYGNIQRMTEAWLRWGVKRGYVKPC